jgi:hypothetical protein
VPGVGYKITDVFSLYAGRDGYDAATPAQIGTLLFIRPLIGVSLLCIDRTQTTLWLVLSFIISFLGSYCSRQELLQVRRQSYF